MSWRIELSRSAVASLRALPRERQKSVAARIRHLQDAGLPEGCEGDDDPCLVAAGDQVLVCVAHPDERRIVVVTLRGAEQPVAASAAGLARRWIQSWMGGEGMGTLLQDLRFALRSLRKSPGFSAVAVLTLGLGIGAATAIYSVADGVIFEPLPYGEPDEVATVWASWNAFPEKTWLSVPEFQLLHQETRAFEDMALYQLTSANFTSEENPERVGAAGVTPNTFDVLGVEPEVGRPFTWDEARSGAPVAVLAWETWQRRLSGDPAVVGRTVQIDGSSVDVVGVMPRGFILPVDYRSSSPSEVFFPLDVDLESPAPVVAGGGSHGSYAVARLLDGRTVEDARADVNRIFEQSVEHTGLYGPEFSFAFRVFGAKEDVVGSARGTILFLLGAVGLVLLIACGNVANLLLSRSEARGREMAVRKALGAGRGRILRQLLTESALLALPGGALGVAMAAFGVRALLAIDPSSVPRSASVSVDASVLLFALAASLLTALFFGMAPALRVIRRSAATSLHESRRGAGAGSSGMQRLLVGAQMAMAVILLTASVLMMRTFTELREVDPGFRTENVLTFRTTLPSNAYSETGAVVAFYEELRQRLRALPGVRAAGAARQLPLASTMGDWDVRVEGYTPGPNEVTSAEWQYVTPGYLEVMGIPLLAGRAFDEGDGPDAPDVIIVNRSMARHYWGDRDPLGAMVTVSGADTSRVVGVVGDVAHNELTGSMRERFYRPHAQATSQSLTFTLATEGEPRSVLPAVRNLVRGMDPTLPISQVRTMDEVLAAAVAEERFALLLLGAFAGIALTLAVVGVYGVISYAVSRRTSEIGIRMALGAESSDVVAMVVRQGMAVALAGVVIGTGAALLLSRFMQGMLYGVEPQDAVTFTAVPALFAAVALVACWVPAMRAARVDPLETLRGE